MNVEDGKMYNAIIGSVEVEHSSAKNADNLGFNFVFDGFALKLVI